MLVARPLRVKDGAESTLQISQRLVYVLLEVRVRLLHGFVLLLQHMGRTSWSRHSAQRLSPGCTTA